MAENSQSSKSVNPAGFQYTEFTSFDEFLKRTYLGIENVLLLIRIGAFRDLSPEKQQLKWRTHLFFKGGTRSVKQPELFVAEPKNYTLPSLPVDQLEQAFEEMELLGFPLSSPFLLLKNNIKLNVQLKHLKKFNNQCITVYGYLVSIKTTKTNKQELMNFGTFIDYWGTYFETVHFPPTLKKFPFRGAGIYELYGKVTEEFGYYSLEIIKSEKLTYVDDPRYAE